MVDQNQMAETSILLQSPDHSQLLDVIDLLRSQGVSHYVALPQLIVCGDQSSGKSSVLEAVSGVHFPTKDGFCTRFATELILRRDPQMTVMATIIPGANRTEDQKRNLARFSFRSVKLEEVPQITEDAKEAMGLNAETRAFSDDVLRIEITGPKQPHLTLVDLPGLIHSENKLQSAEDIELVSSLVQRYMSSPRSIILAVVSARNDYANQIVTKLARNFDPKGVRTLGIITKPDTLPTGSSLEKGFVSLAKNEDVYFRLGWHVLKNRDYANKDCPTEERDHSERELFSRGIWTSIPGPCLGVEQLKPRLSGVLRDQIISELSNLVRDVEGGIQECNTRLGKLGVARGTLKEQRMYLLQISQKFSSLLSAAVNGVYVQDFFGNAMSKAGYSKRLRAVVQALLLEFAEEMRLLGHTRDIVDEIDDESERQQITRLEFLKEVQVLMRRIRGRELVGTFNPLIVGDLFYQQSEPWQYIADSYSSKVMESVSLCLGLITFHVMDESTSSGLQSLVIDPAVEKCKTVLARKVAELIKPHKEGHPITYNQYFTETVQMARQEHYTQQLKERINEFFKLKPDDPSIELSSRFNTGDLLDALISKSQKDMELFACSESAYCMEAYYKVALKVFVDNFSVLGVEACLLEPLVDILSPNVIMELPDETVQAIAAEGENEQEDRARTIKKLTSLEAGLETLTRLRRLRLGGTGTLRDHEGELTNVLVHKVDDVSDANDPSMEDLLALGGNQESPAATEHDQAFSDDSSETSPVEMVTPHTISNKSSPFSSRQSDESWIRPSKK